MLTPILPPNLKRGLENYLNHGIQPGSFLLAVLENDLRGAVEKADSENRQLLPQIVAYLYNNVPHTAWGSTQAVEDWMVEHQVIAEQMRLAAKSQPISKLKAAA